MQKQVEQVVSYRAESASHLGTGESRSSQLPAPRELDTDISGNSKLWAVWEKLNKETPTDAKAASEGASILLRLYIDPLAREEIIKALRTESPKHFAFEEVRVEAFRTLAKYSHDPRLAILALEELEGFPHRAKSCAQAVTILNALPPIKDREVVDRITELFIRERNNPDYTKILSTLVPQFEVYASNHLSRQLQELSEQAYLGKEQGSAAIIRAMALSSDPSCIVALCKIAKQDFFEGSRMPKWLYDTLGWTFACGMLVVPGAIAGGLIFKSVDGAVGGAVLNFAAAALWAVITSDSKPSSSSSSTDSDYKPRTRVSNSALALEAISALGLSTAHDQARETLVKIATDPSQTKPLSDAARQSLKSGRPSSDLYALLREVKDPTPELRELSLRGLANKSGDRVLEAVTQATNDRDRIVRQVAYDCLAKFKKNQAST